MRRLLRRSGITAICLLVCPLPAVQGCVTASVVHGQRASAAAAGPGVTEVSRSPVSAPVRVRAARATYSLPDGELTVTGGVARVELGLVGLLVPIVPLFIHARPEPRDMVEIELRLRVADSAQADAGALFLDPNALRLSANGGSAVTAACLVPSDDGGALWMAPSRVRCADWRWPRWPFRSFDRATPAPLEPGPDGAPRYELRPGRRVFVLFPLPPDPSHDYELRLDDVRGADGSVQILGPLRFRSDWGISAGWLPAI